MSDATTLMDEMFNAVLPGLEIVNVLATLSPTSTLPQDKELALNDILASSGTGIPVPRRVTVCVLTPTALDDTMVNVSSYVLSSMGMKEIVMVLESPAVMEPPDTQPDIVNKSP